MARNRPSSRVRRPKRTPLGISSQTFLRAAQSNRSAVLAPTIDAFVEASNRARDADQLFALYLDGMARLGFDRIVFSLMSDHAAIGRPACHGIARNYPEDWMMHYMAAGYCDVDPVRTNIRARGTPFVWAELGDSRPLSGPEQEVMDGGRDVGLHDGIGIPLRGTLGAVAGVGAASSVAGLDVTRDLLSKANLLSQQFYAVYLQLCATHARSRPSLSRTEEEILKWAAAGKTKVEIGEILALSRHTVDYYCRRIFRRLDAPNMTVAVLTAINLNLIQL